VLFTTRWWKTAAIAFAVLEFVGLWVAFLFLLLGTHLPTFTRGALVVVIAPLVIAALLATVSEWRRHPEEAPPPSERRRGNLLVILGGFAFPFIAGPVTLLAFIMLTRFTTNFSLSQMKAHQTRPIVAGDQDGFCAPPRYSVRDSLPLAELTVRVPRAGRYRFSVEARDRSGRFCGGQLDTILPAKTVSTVSFPIAHGNGVALRPGDITWPVTVRHILVRSFEDRRVMPLWADVRQGDSLATIAPP
jgi:hypothetical protein